MIQRERGREREREREREKHIVVVMAANANLFNSPNYLQVHVWIFTTVFKPLNFETGKVKNYKQSDDCF